MANKTAEFRRPAVLKFIEQTGCAVDMEDFQTAIYHLGQSIGNENAMMVARGMGYFHHVYFKFLESK